MTRSRVQLGGRVLGPSSKWKNRRVAFAAAIAMCCLASSFGCASSKKSARSAQDEDTLVPQNQQRESEQLYGEQQMFMDDLNATPSEQAGARHERAVDQARDPGREQRKKK